MFPNKVEENQSITIHCIADVGSPRGYIQIWKKTEKSNTYKVIYKSNTTNSTTENCTELINVTTTFIITREDNGALFGCTSKNNFTKEPIPNSDTSKISVICMYKKYFMLLHFIFDILHTNCKWYQIPTPKRLIRF